MHVTCQGFVVLGSGGIRVKGSGSKVWCVLWVEGFRVKVCGLGCRVCGLLFVVCDLGFGVSSLWFVVCGFLLGVWGLGFVV